MTDNPAVRQVLVHPAVWPHLELWLAGRNLILARVPVEDDLPTYAMVLAAPGDAEKVIRDASRQAAGQPDAAAPSCTCIHPPEEDAGQLLHASYCPAARQPDTQQPESALCSGPVPCEDGGEPCDKHERDQAHAEGEHAFCGPECVAGQPDTQRHPGPAPVVAYRDPRNPRVLLCRDHGRKWHGVVPLTADDLPDGGICVFGRLGSFECGRDVLIPYDREDD